MAFKILGGLLAMALLLGYMLPGVIKLKEIDLAIATAIGIVMAAVDLWQSLQSKDD